MAEVAALRADATRAHEAVKCGLEASSQLPQGQEKDSQLLPLYFNGLVALGYMRLVGGGPLDVETLAVASEFYQEHNKLDTDESDRKNWKRRSGDIIR